ncbi:hypothetical protein [Microbacterium gorillae]|uniref:hypothetical protein n=1 Tax=Microbacterium gorillae TaxID=1231063 RepID=UPI0006949EFE|nr:hypothetical protein [Microbacterium gorillae]
MATRTTPGKRRKKRSRKRPRLSAARRRALRERRFRAVIVSAFVVLGVTTAAMIGVVGNRQWDVDPAAPGVTAAAVSADHPAVDGWDAEQLANAKAILDAGNELGLGERDQTIAVMTAMGESSLRNLDHGDWETSGVKNPDGTRTTSLGLFQQQDWWGTRAERMDPRQAALLFYRAMRRAVPDAERGSVSPTLIAHRTQRNEEPEHYEPYWRDAVTVVRALSGQ